MQTLIDLDMLLQMHKTIYVAKSRWEDVDRCKERKVSIKCKWLTSPLPPHPTSPIIVGRGQIFSEIQTIYLPWRAVKLICCNSVYYTAAIICFHFQVRGEVSSGQTGSGLLGQSASTLRWPTRKLEAAPFIIPCHTPSHLLYCKLHTNCQLLHQLHWHCHRQIKFLQ